MTHGGTHEASRPPKRRGIRVAAVFLALAALTIPMAYVFANYWSVTSSQVADLHAEERGLRYLKPLTRLISTLTDTQSATLNGKSVDAAAVRAAVSKVAAADDRDGTALGAHDRWVKLRKQIETTVKDNPKGHEAYHAYTDLNTTALALVTRIGDTSKLNADATFAHNTTLLQLPSAIVQAGQVADLLRPAETGPSGKPEKPESGGHGHHSGGDHSSGGDHAGGGDKSEGGNDHAGESPAAPAGRVAVALDNITSLRNTLRTGLQGGGGGAIVTPEAIDAFDEFSAAVVALTEAAKPAAEAEKPAIDDADDASERARKAALALTDEMLGSLGSRLSDRIDELTGNRLASGIAMVVGVVMAAVLLWLALPGPAERWRDQASQGVTDYQPAPGTQAAGSAQSSDLIDARDLLSSEELLRVGRAVRATRGGPEDGSR